MDNKNKGKNKGKIIGWIITGLFITYLVTGAVICENVDLFDIWSKILLVLTAVIWLLGCVAFGFICSAIVACVIYAVILFLVLALHEVPVITLIIIAGIILSMFSSNTAYADDEY